MRLPRLPAEVRIVLDEHHRWEDREIVGVDGKPGVGRVKQEPLPDAPVFVCRPVGFLRTASYGTGIRLDPIKTYARVFLDHLIAIENLYVDGVAFDAKNDAHVDALKPHWGVEVGNELFERTYLTDEDAGKSS